MTGHKKRLVKEALIELYRRSSRWLEYPVYYVPWDPSAADVLPETISAFQEMSEIPWPDDRCIILAEEGYEANILGTSNFLISIVFDRKKYMTVDSKDELNVGSRKEGLDITGPSSYALWYMMSHYSPETRTIRHVPIGFVVMNHMDMGNAFDFMTKRPEVTSKLSIGTPGDTPADILSKMREHIKTVRRGFALNTAEDFAASPGEVAPLAKKFEEYGELILPDDRKKFWMFAPTKATIESESNFLTWENGFMFAGNLLVSLSNIMMPCGYLVRTTFNEGFGPSSMRRMIVNKPIFSYINFERLYREKQGGESEEIIHKSPHHRRGHVRWHWKKAGVDRASLPPSAKDRILLAHRKRVQRSAIPPMWVGPKTITFEGMTFDLQMGERRLPDLWESDQREEQASVISTT